MTVQISRQAACQNMYVKMLTGISWDNSMSLSRTCRNTLMSHQHSMEAKMRQYLSWSLDIRIPWLTCSPGLERCLASPHLDTVLVMTQEPQQGLAASEGALLWGHFECLKADLSQIQLSASLAR